MAASGYTPLALYHSTTPGAEPTAGNLVDGELALNIADGYLFFKRSGVVENIAGLSGYSGISGYSGYSGISGYSGFSGISGYSGYSGINGTGGISGTSGFSGFSGISGYSGYSGFSGISGAQGPTIYPGSGIPLSTGSTWNTSFSSANPVPVTYGGTGISGVTAGQIPYGSTSTALASSSSLFWSSANTRLGVGLNSPIATLHVKGGNSNNAVVDNGGQQFTTLSWYNNGTAKAQTYWDQTNSLFVSGTDVAAAYVFKTNVVEKMRISSSAAAQVSIGSASTPITLLVNGTDALGVPAGTVAQRPTGSDGYIRYNSDYDQYEGYANGAWSQIGGGATGAGGDQVFVENTTVVTTNYTLTTGKNAMSVGPITVNSGVTVTVPSDSRWVVL